MDASSAVIDQLARTKGWTLFFAVLLWIGAAFLVLGSFFMFAIGALGGLGSFGGNMAGGAGLPGLPESVLGFGLGAIYLVMAVAYIYPALKLTKYSKKISDLIQTPHEDLLVMALNEQRAFWKYVGIVTIAFIILYIVAVAAAIIIPAIVAVGASQGG